MTIIRSTFALFLVLISLQSRAQLAAGYAARYAQPGVDVLNYDFSLTLSDSTNRIIGETKIRFTRTDDRQTVWFDLISQKADSTRPDATGMRVRRVTLANGKAAPFSQRNDRVFVNLPAAPNQPTELTIQYAGIPERGLIISRNKFGDRTFFGDNWPNNARHYLPVVDYLADKATCSFTVNAPVEYRIISNGKFISETPVPGKTPRKLTRWQESTPIPTKVMVIGAARFDVDEVGSVAGVPVQSWLYPNDSQKGFIDYRPAKAILEYFSNQIGPYSYEKLANVESTTVFGGMENASCIFYNEKVIVGRPDSDVEALLAHEIAHQWFGNSATEADWSQLWLSEGFATYFSALYLEHTYGKDTLNAVLNQNKGQIFRFTAAKPKGTIIDSTAANLNDLLNPNSYQKGGWVLHMLRCELGDDLFWKGIRAYYAAYRNRNARTSDLVAIMEQTSGRKLGPFFQQWLNQPGYPEVVWGSSYDAGKQSVVIDVRQAQRTGFFTIPLVFSFRDASGREIARSPRLTMNKQTQTFTVPAGTRPATVVIDPNNTVLMRAVEMGK